MSESPSFHSEGSVVSAEDAVALGGRTDLHLGDYVGYERITPSKEWRLSLGKVIGFPSTRTVKVAVYDPKNSTTVAQDPESEQELHARAEEEGKMDVWHNREALREDYLAAVAKEREATDRLFTARDSTVVRQQAAGEKVAETLEALDAARRELRAIPAKEWKLLRNPMVPTDELAAVVRSLMLVIYEDGVTAWEDMQDVMRRPDFVDRLLSWDCTVTPMSVARRKRIFAVCAGEPETQTKKRRRSRSPMPQHNSVAEKSSAKSPVPTFDVTMRAWLNAQIVCSEAARAQENVINDCFAEQQEQRVLLREINDMRVGLSMLQYQMLEMKNAILNISDAPKAIMPLDAYPTDNVFYKRTYPDTEGRFVQQVVLRESVVINFGPMADEDTAGYVRLNPDQVESLRSAVITANVRHDAEEMEELLARKEREEQEMAELKARINELRGKSSLTAEEEEELEQLEKLYADAERRHHATLSRIADLYACGRGAREITLALRRPEARYTRLHCKMSGDWDMILNDPERYQEMLAAFSADISNMLNVPAHNVLDVDARSGSLLIDFTVKHNGDLDDEELQELVNKGQFTKLSMFYEKVTFKKTSPLNTSQQQDAWDEEQAASLPLPISGMGLPQTLADYYNADGTLDEEFSAEVRAHADYRKCVITIPPVREDYDLDKVNGAYEQYAEDEEAPNAEVAAAAVAESTADEMEGEETMMESLPPTAMQGRAAAEEEEEEAAAAAAAAAEAEEAPESTVPQEVPAAAAAMESEEAAAEVAEAKSASNAAASSSASTSHEPAADEEAEASATHTSAKASSKSASKKAASVSSKASSKKASVRSHDEL